MARRPKGSVPALQHHVSGRARVRINGRDFWLGKWGTPEAQLAYERLIAEYLASGRIVPGEQQIVGNEQTPASDSWRPQRGPSVKAVIGVARTGRGKSPPGLFPGMKTSGFSGSRAAAIASLRSSRLCVHSLLAWLAAAVCAAAPPATHVADGELPAGDARPVKLILDTDMSGDCDDAGTLAMLHALADRGECGLLAVVTNRRDLANASAAAADAINTFYGRPDLPVGVGREPPTALQRTSLYTPALRDGFPHDARPDDEMPDALAIYRNVLAAQPDGSVTICGVGAFSNLAELCRREPDLVKAKVRRLVVMGGQFPPRHAPETNIATHPAAAAHVARAWPTEIVWQGFDVGDPVITGEALKDTPRTNPVRRAYEVRRFGGRSAIEGGQPSYDQAAALYAVRGPDRELWREERGGAVAVDDAGLTRWEAGTGGRHVLVHRACAPEVLAGRIEPLMTAPPAE